MLQETHTAEEKSEPINASWKAAHGILLTKLSNNMWGALSKLGTHHKVQFWDDGQTWPAG